MRITNKQKFLALQKIEKEHGKLEPSVIVDAARDPNHVLHNYFEWDNGKAADEYRLWQARQLIVSVYVVSSDEERVQVWHNVKISESKPEYNSLPVILSNTEKKKSLIRYALNEIKYWQEKYRTIHELSKVVNLKELNKLISNY